MDIIKKLLSKYLTRETISYLIFGVLTTVVNFAVFIPLVYIFKVSPLLSNIIAWFAAVIFAFIVNKLYVFRSTDFSLPLLWHEISLFFSARVLSLIVEEIGIFLAELVHIDVTIAKIFLAVLVIIINYVLSKKIIFRKDYNNIMNKKSFEEKIKDNLVYIMAFVIPLIILGGIFIGRGVFPFGDEMYLRSDCYHQYAPFYQELYRKLTTGGNLTYSWEIGMGLNFTSLYAYYLASPVNLLLGILPAGQITNAMQVLILVKVALACTACSYYLSKRFNTKSLAVAAFSIFYGFSSYFAAFSWNIMWLDCLILLPLIVLGLERLVKENKSFLYCLSLGLAIFSNYYIAIMLCIYCVIYFVYLLIVDEREKTSYFVSKKIVNFALYSLLAGGFAACLLLPEIYTLGLTSSGKFSFPETLTNYFSIMEMLSRNVIKMYASIFDAHSPNLFFSCASYLLIPLYCLCSKVPKKEKVGKVAIAILFLFSFNLNIPNYIWHGLHYPNSLPCRESFIFIFLLITMCFEAAIHYKSYTDKQIFGSFAGGIALLLILEREYVGTKVFGESSNTYYFNFIYLTMAFVLFYLIILVLSRRPGINKNFVIYLLFVVIIAEAAINTDATGYSTTSRSAYHDDNAAIEALIKKADLDDNNLFYRTEKINRRTKNDAAWNGYYGISTFSSTANASITEVLGRLGFERSANAYSFYGYTPLTAAMLSVKYMISNNSIEDTAYLSKYLTEQQENGSYKHLYQNNYWLPLGFMVHSDLVENWKITGNNPFAVQNSFVNASLGTTDTKIFTQLGATCVGSDSAEIVVTKEDHVFVYITSYIEKVNVTATCANDPLFSYSKSFSGLKHRQILDLGVMPAGTTITLSTSDEISSLQVYAYAFDEETFDKVYAQYNDETFDITKFEDTYIKGTVKAKASGLMYTSINMDKGWKVYVDGKETKWESIHGAFIGVPVTEGEHTIEFKFFPVGLGTGLALTFISIAVFTGLVVLNYRRNKKGKPTESIIFED